MTEEPAYDDPRTLAGRLQRGRGLGARQALTHPGASDLVYACVAVDHRCDGGHLLDALTGAAAAGEWCAMEAPARGLGRLRFTKAGPALAEAWQATVHSAARAAILEGLLGCAPEAAGGCAAEALDDCEPAVQEAACAVVPDTAYARTRLRALSGDPLAPEVHGAARRRLDRFPAR